jgi:hypothetical protein
MVKYFYQLNDIISTNIKKKLFIFVIIIIINTSLEIINLNLLFLVLNYFINPAVLEKYDFFSYVKIFFFNYNLTNILISIYIFSPSILVYNDAVFTESDFKSLASIGQGNNYNLFSKQ